MSSSPILLKMLDELPPENRKTVEQFIRFLYEQAQQGEVVKHSLAETALRPYGLCSGDFVVPEDFDAPLPDDVIKDFEGE